jgi:hypothetical protein
MKETTTEEKLFDFDLDYNFPQQPFESIGFALSGGGFRAACYGLGVLSVFDALKLDALSDNPLRLLDKIEFISSASGGTITLLVYTAALRKGIGFKAFFCHLNQKLTGELLLGQALGILNDEQQWKDEAKKRNPINAFARAYHASLLDFLSADEKCLDLIMAEDNSANASHVKEFCFNATEFYTGLSFRFQAIEKNWNQFKGGKFGNHTIGVNWKSSKTAIKILRKIRLCDILASSSCFPLGFEPIIFPRDFSYSNGPQIKELKAAIVLKPYSWGEGKKYEVSNLKSRRALEEKKFVDNGEFGLMDGGICDNQGLYSLLLANNRKVLDPDSKTNEKSRFDLMMVSDVASFYMKPFTEPSITADKWNQNSIQHYWNAIKRYQKNAKKGFKITCYIVIILNMVSLGILAHEGITYASVLSEVVLLFLLGAVVYIKYQINGFFKSRPILAEALQKSSLEELYAYYFPENNFKNQTILKMIVYLKEIIAEDILNMLYTRVKSAETMISDVFLKHVRRLIYDRLFTNPAYKYRRLNNPIYRLSYTNDKNRRKATFERFFEGDNMEEYAQRKRDFEKDIRTFSRVTPEMQDMAEIAYNAPTALWFSAQEEIEGKENVRKAIIATGQFSTCISLLQYTLALRYSRNFSKLSPEARSRIIDLLEQLKKMMQNFESNPLFLYEKLTGEKNFP